VECTTTTESHRFVDSYLTIQAGSSFVESGLSNYVSITRDDSNNSFWEHLEN
jgi:hypothetical protein